MSFLEFLSLIFSPSELFQKLFNLSFHPTLNILNLMLFAMTFPKIELNKAESS